MRHLSPSLFSMLLLLLLCFACETDDTQTSKNDNPILSALRLEIASNLANNLIQPSFQKLAVSTEDLEIKVAVFAEEQSEEALTALRASLAASWESWQYASPYQYGPAESNTLRKIVNTYPTNVEKIEGNIREKIYALNSFSNFEAGGFPAIDYLINAENAEATVAKFASDENRFIYLKQLASTIHSTVSTVQAQFIDGAFIQGFISEDASGMDVGSALGMQVNAIDFHFQRAVRDGKVAIPAGIRSSGVTRPKATEANYAGYSRQLLLESLKSYINLFKGIGINKQVGPSLFAYLEEINQTTIAAHIEQKLNEVVVLVQNLNDDLSVQIEIDNQKMVDVFLAMQEVVTLIKSDMVSVMGVTITNQDNDGD